MRRPHVGRNIVRHALLIVAAVVVGSGLGFGVDHVISRHRVEVPYHPVSQVAVSASHDPLSILAQRARSYPGGQIEVVRQLATTDTYHSEELSYPSDGNLLYAQAVIPNSDRPKKGYPTIIFVHGNVIGPSTYRVDSPYYTKFAAVLASHGYLVLMPTLRGYANSQGRPDGAYFSPGYTADVLNLYNSLSSYSLANRTRIGLAGHSMGGHVVLDVMAVAGRLFQSASINSGAIGSMDDMERSWQPTSDRHNPLAVETRTKQFQAHGDPNTSTPFWHDADPYSYLSDIKHPIQIQYCDDDPVVPARFDQELISAFHAAGNDPEVHELPTGGHTYSGDSFTTITDNMVSFFNRTI